MLPENDRRHFWRNYLHLGPGNSPTSGLSQFSKEILTITKISLSLMNNFAKSCSILLLIGLQMGPRWPKDGLQRPHKDCMIMGSKL